MTAPDLCPRGHDRSTVGVTLRPNGRGVATRRCRECARIARVRYQLALAERRGQVAALARARGLVLSAPVTKGEKELAQWQRRTIDAEAWLARPMSPGVAELVALREMVRGATARRAA